MSTATRRHVLHPAVAHWLVPLYMNNRETRSTPSPSQEYPFEEELLVGRQDLPEAVEELGA